ncbi:RHS repeat-associated core domain-containing protein [Chryseobacterium sp.]|uniref:RHS repeat-associated core domain-containing protein n=1 Tax=Chryseobacterium sp. TaxID=1871047 RepID=UPI0025B956C7|nr:RHS repeat-associated core domain-containing protein [Chryseobacterium sp.]
MVASSYHYKYNGKELQETGMYAMDFRHYMPDIGRFTGMDRLSEILPTLTPYRFGFDNPVNFADPTGLFETRKEARAYRREHGITGSINRNDDGSYSINDKTNHVSYTMGTESSGENFANDGVQESVLITGKAKPQTTETTNWYGPGGQANWAFGTGATIAGFKGIINSEQMYATGLRRGLAGNYQLSGRNLSLFGKMPATKATIPISKVGRWGGILSKASFGAGVVMDGVGVWNYTQNPNSPNAVHPAKAGLNTTMGAIGVWGGPPGAIISTVYFGIDAFYPGGWAGAATDQERLYQENKAIDPNWQAFPGAMKQ